LQRPEKFIKEQVKTSSMAKKESDHRHGRIKNDIHPEWAGDKRWAPLSTGFMLTSIVGFLISAFYIPKFSVSLAVAFALVFACMFIASIISMTRASPDTQLAAKPIR
jgi:uncharacterized membrane protein